MDKERIYKMEAIRDLVLELGVNEDAPPEIKLMFLSLRISAVQDAIRNIIDNKSDDCETVYEDIEPVVHVLEDLVNEYRPRCKECT